MELNIRQENKNDYDQVYEVVKRAFEQAEYTDGDEQNLVNRLRNSHAFVPELSLVAEQNGEIVGHILFTEATIGETTQLVLAPLSILPSYQKAGIGGKLIVEGHRIAKELRYEYVVLVGHSTYYPRFGYKPASQFGIQTTIEVADENFMAFHLQGEQRNLDGTVTFAPEFGIE